MNIDDVANAVRDKPFQAFTICTADGRKFPIPHPEFIAIAKTIIVAVSEDKAVVSHIDPANVVSLGYISEPQTENR